jgi:DNA-binding LacI/PurR family transcriptional regulator
MKKTIVQIAKELNLAPSTISKIVNNKGKISADTRKRVLDYVKKTGYVAQSNARILSSKKSQTIGVIYSDIALIGFEHPFFSSIFQSFKNTMANFGYDIVLIVNKIGHHELTYLEWCRNKKVDGVLIVMGNINNENIIELVNSDIPCVSTDIMMPNLHTVISNDHQGIALGIEYARHQKIRKIKLLSGPVTSRSFADRILAFRDIMEKNKIKYRDEDIIIANGYDIESGYELGLQLAKNIKSKEIFLCTSDVLAFGLIRAFENSKLNIPNDVMVIGYDDIDFAKHFTPPLSTIKQNTEQIGIHAATKLFDLMNQKEKIKQSITKIDVELIHRNTTVKQM